MSSRDVEQREYKNVINERLKYVLGPENVRDSVEQTLYNVNYDDGESNYNALSAYVTTQKEKKTLQIKSYQTKRAWLDQNHTVFDVINLQDRPLHEVEVSKPVCTFLVVIDDNIIVCDLSHMSLSDIFVKCKTSDSMQFPSYNDVFLDEWYLKVTNERGSYLIPVMDVALLFETLRNHDLCPLVSSELGRFMLRIRNDDSLLEAPLCFPILFYTEKLLSVNVSQLCLVHIVGGVNIFHRTMDTTSGTHCSNTMQILDKGFAVRTDRAKTTAASADYYETLKPNKRVLKEELRELRDESRDERRNKRARSIVHHLLQFMN